MQVRSDEKQESCKTYTEVGTCVRTWSIPENWGLAVNVSHSRISRPAIE